MARNWYVDSSVVLRALVDNSRSAANWLSTDGHGDGQLISSRFLELEVWRVCRREGINSQRCRENLDILLLTSVDNNLLAEAAAIEPVLKAADSIHLAAALRIGTANLTFVTHDAQLARAAQGLGFEVFDPVTDDPNRPPVA